MTQDFLAADHILDILRPLLLTHSPTGHEDEATEWVRQWLSERMADVSVDGAGNVIARIPGTGVSRAVGLIAHKDEIGMIVKRIEPDGCLRVGSVGGSYPWKYGEGPVDILGTGDPTPGYLCFGSVHVSEESREVWAARTSSNLSWDMCWVDTRLSRRELEGRGIHVGTKVVVSRSRKALVEIGDSVGCFAMDDKALVAIMLAAAENLIQTPPPGDVYLVVSAGEEIGSGRAAYAAGNLPAEVFLALEVAPVMPEYGLTSNSHPVILYKDAYNMYDEGVCRELEEAAEDARIPIQRAVLSSFGSDLSFGAQGGRIARYGCIAAPCENTHGFEFVHRGSLSNLGRVVVGWVRGQVSGGPA